MYRDCRTGADSARISVGPPRGGRAALPAAFCSPAQEGLQPAGSGAEQRLGRFGGRGSTLLAGKGCGSRRDPRPLTWAQPGPLRWAQSSRRWRGPATPWCSRARRRHSPRRRQQLLLLAETLSCCPRPGGSDPGVERRAPRPQPGRLSPRRGAGNRAPSWRVRSCPRC